MGPLLQDIKRGGYCFTDGVGAAGKEVMHEAAKALGHNQGINATPSAIQIRLGWVNDVSDTVMMLNMQWCQRRSSLLAAIGQRP